MKYWVVTGAFDPAGEAVGNNAAMSATVTVSCEDDADIHTVIAMVARVATEATAAVHLDCPDKPAHHTATPEGN